MYIHVPYRTRKINSIALSTHTGDLCLPQPRNNGAAQRCATTTKARSKRTPRARSRILTNALLSGGAINSMLFDHWQLAEEVGT